MIPENMHFQLSANHASFYDDLVIYSRDPESRIVTCALVSFQVLKSGMPIPDGARLPVSPQSLANLMTCLWSRGIRPEGYKGTEGEIKRMEDHLRDERELVGHLLPIVLNAAKSKPATIGDAAL